MPSETRFAPPTGPVVVTGGGGFIGRSVVAALRAVDVEVVVVDIEPVTSTDPGVTTIRGDLADPDVRERAMATRPGALVHLAAATSVLQSTRRPAQTYRTNVEITQELLESCRAHGVGRFVLASTNAVVGDVGEQVINEDLPLRPLTPYGATKAACEMLMSGYSGAYGISTCALRFSNVYGPGMAHKDSFVPRLMRAALAGDGVQVYGDGTQRRDLVHVADVAAAVLRALALDVGGPVIIGSGRSGTVLDLIDAAREATGRPIAAEHVPAVRGEMPAVVIDIARARAELDWAPSMSLTEGLATVWDDFRRCAS
jgi:UDP-glucose 4-epimerase